MFLQFSGRRAILVIYVTAAAIFIFYFCALPLKFALILDLCPEPRLLAGMAIFETRFALRRAGNRRARKKHAPLRPELLSPALAAGKYLLRKLRLEYLEFSGLICESDAARTALLFGLCDGLRRAAAPLGDRLRIRVCADFSGSGSALRLTGMIRLRAGHIILAALCFALKLLEKRLRKWKTDIPLKISCMARWRASAT